MSEAPLCACCRKRPAERPWLPFCGERCKMLDLGRWLSGDYRVPGTPVSLDADEESGDTSFEPQEQDRQHD